MGRSIWDEPDGGFVSVKPGRYPVVISAAIEKKSRSTGKLMWEISLRSASHGGDIATDRLMLQGKGVGITKRKLRVLGFSPDDPAHRELDAEDLLGKRFEVELIEEEYGDTKSMRADINAGENCGYFADKLAGETFFDDGEEFPPADDKVPF